MFLKLRKEWQNWKDDPPTDDGSAEQIEVLGTQRFHPLRQRISRPRRLDRRVECIEICLRQNRALPDRDSRKTGRAVHYEPGPNDRPPQSGPVAM